MILMDGADLMAVLEGRIVYLPSCCESGGTQARQGISTSRFTSC